MHLVVLTGAGVSAESGLGTFRDPAGIWARFDPMKLATPEAFAADPARVQAFYDLRRRNLLDAAPNAAHAALARLDTGLAARGDRLTLVTQNVDDLHERGGSRDVIHMHGELLKARCLSCAGVVPWRADITPTDACPLCVARGRLRPHVVWFGEVPLFMDAIEAALRSADLFAAIGTSGTVYPAAGFAALARHAGARTVELNLEPSGGGAPFHDRHLGPATDVVPAWVDALLTR